MSAASLLEALTISGSRKSDGSANDTGKLYAYVIGGTTPAILYADAGATIVASQPIVLDEAGRIPYTTYPTGLYVAGPTRLWVEDVEGIPVSDTEFYPAAAGTVSIDQDGFTGTTLEEVLNSAYESFGGEDFKYQESGGATPRPVQDKLREAGVSVADFGAVGDGVADDTTAFQLAVNRAIALGGAKVIVPDGTYAISQSIAATSATAVRIVGSGQGNTLIRQSNGSATAFTFATACTDCSVESMTISHSGVSSNGAIAFAAAVRPSVVDVRVITGDFEKGLSITGAGSTTDAKVVDSYLSGVTIGVELIAVLHGSITGTQMNTSAGGADIALHVTTTTANLYVGDCIFFANTGIAFSGTGTSFTVVGCPTLGTNIGVTPIDLTAVLADPVLQQRGNRVDTKIYTAAVGNTLSILRQDGDAPFLIASGGGAGVITVAAPFPTPSTAATAPAVFLDVTYKNASGGAVTWTHNAAFVLSSAIPTTDAHTINVRFRWDRTTSKWRECSRADTLT